ncbi:MAG: hypothetical protein AAF889_07380 [Cyanobacteria bacterium P01_D01_bin.73]
MAIKKLSNKKNPGITLTQRTLEERVTASHTEIVHCPNCGQHAERQHIQDSRVTRTQCSSCDYLMVTCSLTARVIEAYYPGMYPS